MSTTALPNTTPPVWEGVVLPKRLLWRAEGLVRRHRDALIVIGLMAVGLALRLYITRGLWLDEATSVAQAKMGLGRMLSYMRESDVHPPLYQLLLWADIRIFGTSELAVRLPSLLVGTALVPVLYGLGRDMFDRRTGLIAALIGAFGPAVIWYSQEARMYPLFMLFSAIALWGQVRAVRSGTWRAWALYTLASAALLWTHYFSVLHVGTQQLAFLVLIWQMRGTDAGRRLRMGWLRSVVALALLVAPMVTIPLGQIPNYGQRDTVTERANVTVESSGPIYTAITNVASALVGYHSTSTMTKINALWPLGMLAALLALGRGRTRSSLLLVAVTVVPMAVLFVVGLRRNDVFELRYFAGAVPALSLLLARAATTLARSKLSTAVVCSVLVISLSVAAIDSQRDGGNARVFAFRDTLEQVNAEQREGDLLYYEPFYLHPSVHYYAPRFTSLPLVAGVESTIAPGRIFIVDSLSFAEREQSAQRVNQVVERLQKDRRLVRHDQLNNIEVWVFE